MLDPALDIQNVTHRYGEHVALRNLSFAVEPGALFGLLGPNGSGKTTLLRLIMTLMPPSEGTVQVMGADTTRAPDTVRHRLGTVLQQPALDGELTVEENLRFHGALYGLQGAALRERMNDLLALFDLQPRAGERVATLSGGLRRRVDLIRGLLHAPPLLLLDEPTVGLDPGARRTFWDALARLRRKHPVTLVVATHLMEEAENCDQVAILNEGRLVAHDAPRTLKELLGTETLWLDTDDPRALCDRIEAQFGLDATVADQRVQITHAEAPSLLPALYDAFGPSIRSATIRKPTLEDVFLARTGTSPEQPESVVPEQ